MVSSQFCTLNGNGSQRPFLNKLILPSGPPADIVDFELSDVFGPSPCSSEKIHNDPGVIHNPLHETDDAHDFKNSDLQFNDHCLSNQTIGVEDFEVLKVVGKGAFGKVYQVRRVGTSEIYAMKVMHKDKIIQKNHVDYVKSERDMLIKVDHPFIVRLRHSFQVILLLE